MPGVVMDSNIGGDRCGPNSQDPKKGGSPPSGNAGQPGGSLDLRNGSLHTNGVRDGNYLQDVGLPTSKIVAPKEPPELQHITQGFFPFSKLINRSVQQCWNDLSELIAELAEIQVPSPDSSTTLPMPISGKTPGNQSSENLRKKLRTLDFAHGKRAEFIKLLVLSQWSRQAADVSKLIDLQSFIRTQHQAYAGALQWVGDMKRDLVRAQVANPDLNTALEVLSRAGVSSMSDLGYKPPRPLTPRSTLKKLRKINRIISARLALRETIPLPFRTYRVHDGRVTFVVSGEFELDLSVGEENEASQFFFVDIRFLFTPSSSSLPTGRIFSELEHKVNDILRDSGLAGCFKFLHNLVLTNKINILAKQATDLAKGLWSNVLRIELLHRTLVLQYWASRPGAKSWLEIGIQRGSQKYMSQDQGSPSLGLRWMRDGREAESKTIKFDTQNLCLERLLRSVIASHISHILSSTYSKINDSLLFSSGSLFLRSQLSKTEPGDCYLNVQLTGSRHLRVAIEPMSGASILSVTPSVSERLDADRGPDKSIVDDIVLRVARIRCNAAIEEVESRVKMFGFELVNPRGLRLDARRIFPSNIQRFSFFWHHFWDRSWMLAATSSMDGDNWWVVQTRPLESQSYPTLNSSIQSQYALSSAQAISSTLFPTQQQMEYSALADLGHCLAGTLTIHSNARYLAELQFVKFCPPLHDLKIESGLRVPDLLIRYEPSNLPQPFKIALPNGLRKKALIKDTVRLAFHGIDSRRNVAMMVAYGNLAMPSKAFSTLISEEDHSLVFQRAGTGFALRLFAPIGQPVIFSLLESLQRLECVLSIFENLQRKKLEPRSLSLSRIDFAYGPEKDLAASLEIRVFRPSSLMDATPTKVASKTDFLLHLRLGIRFNYPNPHRRIQDTLASNLNRPSADAGLDTFADMLTFTLPLMRALDRIMANPSSEAPLKVQVIARNAKSFQIHYPQESYRFQLVASQHFGRLVWILKDAVVAHDNAGREELKSRLQESLYNSKGDGWRGLGNGVVSDADQVENLLDEVDKCFTSARNDFLVKPENNTAKPSVPDASNQLVTKGLPETTGGIEFGEGARNKSMQHKINTASRKTDVITID